MKTIALVALGSAIGGTVRYLAVRWMDRLIAHRLPWGTIFVNVTGCLLIGLISNWHRPNGEPMFGPEARAFLMTGLLGGYTTFSAFGLQTFQLSRNATWQAAALNVTITVVPCIIAVWAGYVLGELSRPRVLSMPNQ